MTNLSNSSAATDTNKQPSNSSDLSDWLPLAYDIIMLGAILFDLLLISIDLIMMSNFASYIAGHLGAEGVTSYYAAHIHGVLKVLGGFFTIFLFLELGVRWIISIYKKEYMRWFFFPFVHWYEVLGCFPQLRALRLLRAFVIGRRLHQKGYKILPKSWIKTGKFYYSLVLEEVSDRVILTATDNLRQQMSGNQAGQKFLADTLDKNRDAVEATINSLLHQELSPHLSAIKNSSLSKQLSTEVGTAVQEALINTPELRRYLRMIPIAGSLIEEQIVHIGQHLGENITTAINERLFQQEMLDEMIDTIAKTIANIDLNNTELETMAANIANDVLFAFEQQVKIQQWKHQEHFHL